MCRCKNKILLFCCNFFSCKCLLNDTDNTDNIEKNKNIESEIVDNSSNTVITMSSASKNSSFFVKKEEDLSIKKVKSKKNNNRVVFEETNNIVIEYEVERQDSFLENKCNDEDGEDEVILEKLAQDLSRCNMTKNNKKKEMCSQENMPGLEEDEYDKSVEVNDSLKGITAAYKKPTYK